MLANIFPKKPGQGCQTRKLKDVWPVWRGRHCRLSRQMKGCPAHDGDFLSDM